MGKTIGNTFGKVDPNATNDVLNGDIVATGTPGAISKADPYMGLSSDQLRNRRLLKVGGKGLSSALMNQGAQPPQGGQPVQFTFANNQPAYQPPYLPPGTPPFFGSM